MTTSTKYEYWKWAILQPLYKNCFNNVVLIHNKQTDKMYLYDIVLNRKVKRDWSINLDSDYIRNYVYSILTIGQLPEFYKSLPKKYKDEFWDILAR